MTNKNLYLKHCYFGTEWDTLSDKVKNYICDLEQPCDPSGNIQTIGSLTEQRDALVIWVKKLQGQVELLKRQNNKHDHVKRTKKII